MEAESGATATTTVGDVGWLGRPEQPDEPYPNLAAVLFPWARTAVALAVGALVAIVAAGIALRFADLAHLPGGLYPDEAAEGLDALRMLREPGYLPVALVWFTNDGGREALFAYWVAFVFTFLGPSAETLRAAAAAFGVAGVVLIWAMVRRWGMWTSLVAAGWAAGSLWLVVISRDGSRNTIVPFFGALALMALLLWLDRPTRRTAALAGAAIALCALYTYQPLKLLPLVVAIWLLWLRRADAPAFRRLRAGLKEFVLAFLVVGAPMIAVVIALPDNYFGRASYVSALNSAIAGDDPLVHVVRTLLAFGFTGDPNARQDAAGVPLLSIPFTAIAALGVLRLWRGRRDAANVLVLISLPVFLMPAVLAVEGGSPHFLRLLGMAAPLAVAMGVGAAELVSHIHRRFGRWPARLGAAAVALALAATMVGTWWTYASVPVSDRWSAYDFALVQLADAGNYPNTAVIVNQFRMMDVWFLDYEARPTIVQPGTPIANPRVFSRIVAASQTDLIAALGPTEAARAEAVAWDLGGRPTVWVLSF